MAEQDTMCSIPISATFRIIDGVPIMVEADYRNIPADAIARYLIEKVGITPIYGGGDSE
jgi:hypothetical protein